MKNTQISILANLRNAHKELKGTPCAVIKSLYAEAEINDENGKLLKKLLPAKKQTLLDKAGEICKLYKVGETKETARGSYVIKFSADMVFRFLNKEEKERAAAKKTATKKEPKKADKVGSKGSKNEKKADKVAA